MLAIVLSLYLNTFSKVFIVPTMASQGLPVLEACHSVGSNKDSVLQLEIIAVSA